jgi:hypothetical protein
MWRKGFYANRYCYYGLDEHDSRMYVSDYFNLLCHPYNGQYSTLIDNKLYLPIYLQRFSGHVPEYYYLLTSGKAVRLFGDRAVLAKDSREFQDGLVDIIKKRRCVAKPMDKEGGQGVLVLQAEQDGFLINNRLCRRDDLLAFMLRQDGYVVCEFVNQHSYATALNPTTTNTVRLLTCWDRQTGSPFVAASFHRIGRPHMFGADNGALGGLIASIDLDSGSLGHIAHREHGPVRYIEEHPDSGVRVYGTTLPHFDRITATVMKMCSELNFISYIAWDIVITEDSFKVLELNSLTDMYGYQLFGPLLSDKRLLEFYQSYVTPRNSRYFMR